MGTLIFLSSFTVTPELSVSPSGRCAVTKTAVAEVFVVAGFERSTVEVLNGTAARSRVIMAISKTVSSTLDPMRSVQVWICGETLESWVL